jgi:hypothetical protein
MNLMRGIKATLPTLLPMMILASTTRIMKRQIMNASHCTTQLMGRDYATTALVRQSWTTACVKACHWLPKCWGIRKRYVFTTSVSSTESALRKSSSFETRLWRACWP